MPKKEKEGKKQQKPAYFGARIRWFGTAASEERSSTAAVKRQLGFRRGNLVSSF